MNKIEKNLNGAPGHSEGDFHADLHFQVKAGIEQSRTATSKWKIFVDFFKSSLSVNKYVGAFFYEIEKSECSMLPIYAESLNNFTRIAV